MRLRLSGRSARLLPLLFVCILAAFAAISCRPKRGGQSGATLVFGRGGDSVGLDPAHEEDGESFKVAELIFDTLVQYKSDSTEIEPGLATEWTTTPDGLTWTFTLRPNVKFHDGTACDADAVVFSIVRQYDAAHEAHSIGGPYPYWLSLGMSDVIESVRAANKTTVELKLKQAYAPLLGALATPPFAVVSPTALRESGQDFKSKPVGSGPFKFVSWTRDDRIVLERNDDFWGGKPAPERITFRSIPDNATRLLELEQGNIHILEYPDPENLDAIRANKDLSLIEQPGMNVGYVAMNCEHPPLDDVRVRRAINHAINKQAIIDSLYNGLAIAAKNPLPPTIWGYNDAVRDYEYHPDKAKALLKEALPKGFPRELSLYALPVPRPYILNGNNVALAIQSDLQKVGIQTRIQTLEWGSYLEKAKAGDHDLGMLGWIADYADPDNFLWFNLSKDSAKAPAGNIAFYKSDPLTTLLKNAQQEQDHSKRVEMYQRAQEIVHEDAPWIPLAHAKNVAVIRKNVENFTLHPTSWRNLRHVTLGK